MAQLTDIQHACTGETLAIGEPIRGWRQWWITPHGLRGSQGKLWHPGVNSARCHGRRAVMLRVLDDVLASTGVDTPAHTVEPWCTCGLYSWKRPDRINDRTTRVAGRVAGVVELWGRVLIGEHGYRAEYARIVAVCGPRLDSGPAGKNRVTRAGLTDQDRAAVAARYGARYFATLDEAIEHFDDERR